MVVVTTTNSLLRDFFGTIQPVSVHIGTLTPWHATKKESVDILIIVLLVLRVLWHSYIMIRIKFLFPFITLRCGVVLQ